MKRMFFVMCVISLIFVRVSFADRSYSHITTVGSDPNTYDYTSINDAIVGISQYQLSSDNLGCIEVYPGTYKENINNNYANYGTNCLPGNCDLIGMGNEPNDVVIQHRSYYVDSDPEWAKTKQINTGGIKCRGNNLLSNLRVVNNKYSSPLYPDTTGFVQTSVEFCGSGIIENCNIESCFQGIASVDGYPLRVYNCNIHSIYGSCISVAHCNFNISYCTLTPRVDENKLQHACGISGSGFGIIDCVDIKLAGGRSEDYSYYYDRDNYLSGIMLCGALVSSGPSIHISNTKVDLDLTTFAPEDHPLDEGKSIYLLGIYILGGVNTVIENCQIDLNAVESGLGTENDPSDDGYGINVVGVWGGNGSVGSWMSVYNWATATYPLEINNCTINTSRISANSDRIGSEYLIRQDDNIGVITYQNLTSNKDCEDDKFGRYCPRVHSIINGTNYENCGAFLTTIQDSIDYVCTGDTIELADGIYTGPGFQDLEFDGKNITLTSDPVDPTDPNSCLFKPETGHRAFYIHQGETTDLVINGIKVEGANYSGAGAGLAIISSGATISNCYFTNCNSTSSQGGGMLVYGTNSEAIISNCEFSNNIATFCGGLSVSTGEAEITNCTFDGNQSRNHGGGLGIVANGSANITECDVYNNHAGVYGGGIYCSASNSNCEVYSSNIYGNTSDSHGTGICVANGAALEIYDSSIYNNVGLSSTRGGGITVGMDYCEAIINNCSIYNNFAGLYGAGVYVGDNTLATSIIDCNIHDNASAYDGGGIFSLSNLLTVSDTNVYNNTANRNGGGLYHSSNGDCSYSGCTIDDNTATDNGSQVFNSSDSQPKFSNCEIEDGLNGAGFGGTGIAIDGGGNTAI